MEPKDRLYGHLDSCCQVVPALHMAELVRKDCIQLGLSKLVSNVFRQQQDRPQNPDDARSTRSGADMMGTGTGNRVGTLTARADLRRA
jgi:hypothetical protein